MKQATEKPWHAATCKGCVFWVKPDGMPQTQPGQCRRRPPVPSAIPVQRQESQGILIGGQEHREVQLQIQLLTNYPMCAPDNPACGDFVPAADFDKTTDQALAAAATAVPVA